MAAKSTGTSGSTTSHRLFGAAFNLRKQGSYALNPQRSTGAFEVGMVILGGPLPGSNAFNPGFLGSFTALKTEKSQRNFQPLPTGPSHGQNDRIIAKFFRLLDKSITSS